MNKRLAYVDSLQFGKVLAMLYGLIGPLFILGIVLFRVITAPHDVQLTGRFLSGVLGGTLGVVIVGPFVYAIMGFIVGHVTAAIYNFAIKWMGGIRLTITDDTPQLP